MIRHIVAVRFSAGAVPALRDRIFADLGRLDGHLGGILDYRTFTNASPEEPVIHGFRDLFWFDFTGAAARDAYLADPAHQAIGARIVAAADGGLAGIVVLDVAL